MRFIFFPVIFSVILTIHLTHLISYENREVNPNNIVVSSPDSFDVIHYTINFSVPDFTSGFIKAITDVQLKATADSLRNITLQLKHLRVDSIWVDEEHISDFTQVNDYLFIHLREPLSKGTTYIFTVFYQGKPVKDPKWGGVFFTPGTVYNMGVCMSFNPPSSGRLWYPCIDNFKDKATYDYFITVSDTLSVVCPGILSEVIPADHHNTTYHWSLGSPISTYLSAFAISNYAILKDTVQGISHTIPAVYYVQKKDSALARITFSHVPLYLTVFESLFGPYQWEKIGYVGVPYIGGAMEHATSIFIPENVVRNPNGNEDLLIHEFAHSWFGNLVTCSADTDMWLNEGFASYCVPLYYEARQGEGAYLEYMRHLHRNVLQYTHIRDDGYYAVSGIPGHLTYGSTVYRKGADMIYNLRSYLGDKLFFEGLQQYLKTFAFGNISTSEFEKFLTSFTRIPLEEYFNTWINIPGFPHFSIAETVVEPEQNGFKCMVHLTQQLLGRNELSYRVPQEITFMDTLWNEETHLVYLSGKDEVFSFQCAFRPALIMLNKAEKIHDATTSEFKIIRKTGTVDFPDCLFKLSVNQVTDSLFFRVIHHWISPVKGTEDLEMSLFQDHYWSIETFANAKFRGTAMFTYELPLSSHRNTASETTGSNISLLYRASHDKLWEKIDAKITVDPHHGQAVVSTVLPGDYCLAQSR